MSVSGDRPDTLSTYRHLRLAMVLLLGLLLIAVGARAIGTDRFCFEGSISAYYFTSVRAVFVAALCALGACLIVYRGNSNAEDIALNASGAFAFVVAFVPTKPPPDTNVTCTASNVPGAGQLVAAVNNNIQALIATSAVALVVAIVLLARSKRAGKTPLRALFAFSAVLVIASLIFAIWPAGFRANGHNVAAFGTFAGILTVVGLNAADAPNPYRARYGTIALAMLSSLVVLGAAHLVGVGEWRHGVLWIEGVLLVEFLVFWVLQTTELWHRTRRGAPPVLATQS